LCKRHLKKGGVICQYLPLHKLSPEEFRIVIKTFTSVFPNTTIWLAFSHGILLGTSEKLEIDFERLKEKKFADPYLFSISLFLNESAIKALTKGVNINTDNQPYLEFFKLNSLRRENWELNIRQLMNFRIDPTMVFTNIDDTKMLEKYLAGQRHFLKGLIYKNRGDEKKAVEEFYQARMQNPENEESEIYLQHELKQKKLFR
jgi:spermidine synthase